MTTKIGQRLSAAIVDKKVTPQEAEEIVAAAKAEVKWTPALQKEVKSFVSKNVSKLDPAAKKTLEKFIATATVKTDLTDPKLQRGDKTKVTWTPVTSDGKLYIDGVTADDVMQGFIGDCYLAAGISSIASSNPDVIKKAIKDNGDGTYTVRFFQKVETGHPKAVNITIDGDVAMGVNGAYYASARDVNEQWPGLIEKAYAQWKGGYQKIGQGGFASDLFQALSGKEADWSDVKDFTADELFKKIKTSVSHHKPVAAGTFGEHDKRVSYTNTGVHGDHFYTVLGAVEEGGKKYIQLRNPWGSSEPGDGKLDGKDDGIFKLPVADFMKMYENIEFGG